MPFQRFSAALTTTMVLAIFCALVPGADVPATPPVAPVREVVDEFHGVEVRDPYRYMENFKDPQVQSWVKGQAEHARAVLERIPNRDELLNRIKQLDQGAPYRVFGVRRQADGRVYYYKQYADENVSKYYMRTSLAGKEKLLVDPKQFDGPQKAHATLSFAVPSPDGKKLAFGYALAGSEQTTLRVLDIESGQPGSEIIDRMEVDYTDPHWLPDSNAFVYSRRQKLAADAPPTDGYKLSKSYLHKLGNEVEADTLAFAKDLTAAVQIATEDFPSIVIPRGSNYAVGKIKHGDSNELTLYATAIDEIGDGGTSWKKICDVADQVHEFAVHADSVYLLSAKDAPRFKVLRTSITSPDIAKAEVVVPERDAVIDGIAAAEDALYLTLSHGPRQAVYRLPFGENAKLEKLEIPGGLPSAKIAAADPDVPGVLVGTASWVKGGKILAFDPDNGEFVDTDFKPQGKYDDVPGYESHEVMVASHDGVEVPLTIIHKTGLSRDGSHATILGGYGSYGSVSHIGFDPTNLAWLERGGVIAIAHVRGGGALGKAWHLAGQKTNKHNTWKDFIACAEYLIREKYTSPQKLAGQGGSAGGILIGRAITERPDLFAAAIINVGCTDMIRMETTTNGVPNIQEFGTVKDADEFRGLLAMSALHHVKDGDKYPAVLLTHGVNDPRVEPWMSAKMTARLQSATRSGKPVLFRVDYSAGHGIGSTRTQRQEQDADEWAFLLWQVGDPDFQPK